MVKDKFLLGDKVRVAYSDSSNTNIEGIFRGIEGGMWIIEMDNILIAVNPLHSFLVGIAKDISK
jgi:hypothetical protein